MRQVDIGKIYYVLEQEVSKLKAPIVDLVKIQTKDPFKVLLATILSARTKDQATSDAAFRLFQKINKPNDLNKLSLGEIEKLIYPVGFYRNKAKFLKELPIVLDKEFKGVLPETIEELVRLPGVGRKTANLVVVIGFDKPGICVDTHVHRIMNRFGYLKTRNPLETEMTLRKKLPEKYWLRINSLLVAYGQTLCMPISPWCSKCKIKSYCNQIGVGKTR
ncbi:endonuclease III [archaeon]|nr:endonuclease III [archaeon]MBL7057446.1 endonuclease III [Candidatus Woesearchaeota archaeon]